MSNGYDRMQNAVQYALFAAGPLILLSTVIFFYFFFVLPYRQAELLTGVGGIGERARQSATSRLIRNASERYVKKLQQTAISPDEVKDVFSPGRETPAE